MTRQVRWLEPGEFLPPAPPKIDFGKYRGQSIDQVPEQYCRWVIAIAWVRRTRPSIYEHARRRVLAALQEEIAVESASVLQ